MRSESAKSVFLMAAFFLVASILSAAQSPARGSDSRELPFTVRKIDGALIRRKIFDQRDYLLRMRDARHSGFFKRYDADLDVSQKWLRTIYTASSLYTLLKAYDFKKDRRIKQIIEPTAEFLISMQIKEGPHRGAFYYRMNSENGAKWQKLVVGTAAKTIFTLLELYRRTGDAKYLESAKEAGSWLIRQTNSDGEVTPIARFKEGVYVTSSKRSYLYSGQVLSALSKLYAVTRNPAVLQTAQSIAENLYERAYKEDFFVGDDYRPKNTISTSWLAKSFLDFYKVNPDQKLKNAIQKSVQAILAHQINDASDLAKFGRYNDTPASSGNGWINEVLTEVYPFYRDEKIEGSEWILDALLKTTRWLVQNIYSEENSVHLPNPARARGGSIRNMPKDKDSVRTDAVCHSANSLINLFHLTRGKLFFEVPED